MIYTIKNEYLTVKVNSFGAEVISVKDNNSKNEFIWQGDEKYWKEHSPILFPFCGRLYNFNYIYDNKNYEMTLHGFAKRSEFKESILKDDQIELVLESDIESLKIYPFKFSFVVGYKLNKNTLVFSFKVINKDNKDIFFSVGGHPGFNCPIGGIGKFSDYYIEFEHDLYKERLFSGGGLNSCETRDFKVSNRKLPLHHDMFDVESIFLKTNNKKDTLILKSDLNNNFIKVSFDNMTSIGLWHTISCEAPFICIEPWSGFPGRDKTIEHINEMIDITKLSVGKEYNNSFLIEFHYENN